MDARGENDGPLLPVRPQQIVVNPVQYFGYFIINDIIYFGAPPSPFQYSTLVDDNYPFEARWGERIYGVDRILKKITTASGAKFQLSWSPFCVLERDLDKFNKDLISFTRQMPYYPGIYQIFWKRSWVFETDIEFYHPIELAFRLKKNMPVEDRFLPPQWTAADMASFKEKQRYGTRKAHSDEKKVLRQLLAEEHVE